MHLDWWTIGLQTINFSILVWLLHRFLYKPVLTMIDARKAEVRRQFDAAKGVEEKAKARFAAVEAERDPLMHQLADGTPLRVVTACALPSATTDQWKERLRRSLGLSDGMTFEVNPDLIAGAELHFPTAILRFSWQSALLAARTEVGAHGRPR